MERWFIISVSIQACDKKMIKNYGNRNVAQLCQPYCGGIKIKIEEAKGTLLLLKGCCDLTRLNLIFSDIL